MLCQDVMLSRLSDVTYCVRLTLKNRKALSVFFSGQREAGKGSSSVPCIWDVVRSILKLNIKEYSVTEKGRRDQIFCAKFQSLGN